MDPQNNNVSQPPAQTTHQSPYVLLAPIILIGLVLILLAGMGGYYFGMRQSKSAPEIAVSPTIPQETGCMADAKMCPDGSAVGRSGPNCEFAPCPEVKPTLVQKNNGCVTGGCSGELCYDSSKLSAGDELSSICIYRDEYACLKHSRCEKQSDGTCGWTPTQEYNQCIAGIKISPAAQIQ